MEQPDEGGEKQELFKVRKLKKDIWSSSSEAKEQELSGEQVQLRGARKINKGKSERTFANTPYCTLHCAEYLASSLINAVIVEMLSSLRDLVQETEYHVLLKISTATRNKIVMMRRRTKKTPRSN